MILWGGEDVMHSYITWMTYMKSHQPDAKCMFMIEDFFRALRKDLGHSNNKIPKGAFLHLLLKESDLFLTES
jgi:hypothetical protein